MVRLLATDYTDFTDKERYILRLIVTYWEAGSIVLGKIRWGLCESRFFGGAQGFHNRV